MLHRLGQLARGAAGILEHGHVVGLALGGVGGGVFLDLIEQAGIGDHDAGAAVGVHRAAGKLGLLGVGDEDGGVAIAHAQPQRIGAKQGEQRHADGARLHRAEQAYVKRQRGLQHEGDAIALLDALRIEPVRELRGAGADLVEAEDLVVTIGMGHAHSGAAGAVGMARDALMRDVEMFLVAVKQLPQAGGAGMGLSIGIARVIGQLRHLVTHFRP